MSKDLILIECTEPNAYMRTEERSRLGKENEVSGVDGDSHSDTTARLH